MRVGPIGAVASMGTGGGDDRERMVRMFKRAEATILGAGNRYAPTPTGGEHMVHALRFYEEEHAGMLGLFDETLQAVGKYDETSAVNIGLMGCAIVKAVAHVKGKGKNGPYDEAVNMQLPALVQQNLPLGHLIGYVSKTSDECAWTETMTSDECAWTETMPGRVDARQPA